jgi:hypothetical protein
MKAVASLVSLTRLGLGNTAVSDEGLKALHGMKRLRWVSLDGTRVTDTAIAELQKALPEVELDVRRVKRKR